MPMPVADVIRADDDDFGRPSLYMVRPREA
jgi:hypothetical protein